MPIFEPRFWVYFHLTNLLIGIGQQQRHSKHRRHDAKKSRLPGERAGGKGGKSSPHPPPPSPILPLSSSLFQLIVYRKFIPARMKIALCSTEGEKGQGPQWGCCYNCSPCDPRWCRVPNKTMLAAMQIIQNTKSFRHP